MTPTQGEHAQTALDADALDRIETALMMTIEPETAEVAIALLRATAQPAAPQGVAYVELPESYQSSTLIVGNDGCTVTFHFGTGDEADVESWLSAVTERASHGQAPAGASRFADVIAVQRSEAEADPSDAYMVGLYNGMSMMDANYRNITDWEPMSTVPKPTLTAQAAPAAGAVAGPGWKRVPIALSGDMKNAAHVHDIDADTLISIWQYLLAAAPTPAAQADSFQMTEADARRYAEMEASSGASDFAAGIPPAYSVLEDAARLDWLQHNGATVEVTPGKPSYDWRFRVAGLHATTRNNIREAIDAARKQGAKHD